MEVNDIISLDNEKYIISGKIEHNGRNYYTINNMDDVREGKICAEIVNGEEIRFVEIQNKEVLNELAPKFAEDIKARLKEFDRLLKKAKK